MSWRSNDTARVAAAVLGALGQAVLPTVLSPRFRSVEPPNVMQPAPNTFAIWAPIFATSLVGAVVQTRPSYRSDPTLRQVGWPFALSTLCTATWAPLVATRRYWLAQVALVGTAAFGEQARRRVAHAESDRTPNRSIRNQTAPPIGMLAGWGAEAATVNLASMLVGKGFLAPGRAATTAGVGLTLAVGGLVATNIVRSPRAAPVTSRSYAASVLWAFGGIAVGERRSSPPVTTAATAAAALVLAALRRPPSNVRTPTDSR